MALRKNTFSGANVFLSRNLVPPELFDALHDALRLNGAQVFLCCDPSRNAPSDYHVISSQDHEKFEDLRAKGCNLLGPQCVLSCAKEHRVLPKQGYICCLAMDGVKVLASGFEKDEKAKIEKLVTAMGGVLQTKASLDANFVVVKNVLAAKYKCALNVLKKPIVNLSWLSQCWTEHRIVPQEPFRVLPFTGLIICVTRLPADERKEIAKLIVQNGGCYSADLTKKCTHLVSDAPTGDKYVVAQRWGHIHIVTRKWVDQSIAKRGCLDEGLYPVHGASKSCNSLKSLQKEPCYHELSSVASQPAPSKVVEDLEATLSQNIASSFSDANVINNEDTCTEQTKDESNYDCHIAEDSEGEDNDLYLSNCRILLLGFEEKVQSKLVNMIRKGGGTRHMLLSEKLTHIILGAPSDIEKREVRRLAAWGVIPVVRATWLEECDRTKREISVSPRHMVSELMHSKDSICPSMEPPADAYGAKKAKSSTPCSHVPIGQVQEDKSSSAELTLEKGKVGEKPENGPSSRSLREEATKSEHPNHFRAGNREINGICRLKSSSGTVDAHSSGSSNTFRGKSFYFSSSFPLDRRPQIVEWIQQGGGVVVDNQTEMNAYFIVERHGLLQFPDDISKSIVVSTHWIRSSLEEGCMQDVESHILYSPLHCHIPLPGFEGLRFCVSQYEEKERILLRNLCFTLGSKFTEKLTKKVTHLLCKFSNGPKYEAACNWGIQAITAEWITECVRQDTIVSPDTFRPRPVSAQDREAGLCTVSQHPTQAAHMVSGYDRSHLLNESQGPVDSLKETIDHAGLLSGDLYKKPEHSSIHGKRLRSLDFKGENDASKKNKIPEDVKGGSDVVPDVADAIEDLLAQSNKIQDMKSPGTSSCDQNIFSSDHAILTQNHANSHFAYGTSRHWVNRPQIQVSVPNPTGPVGNHGIYDPFSETQTDSQVVGYEEDLTGRQKIIDRVRSQSISDSR